MNRNFGMSHVRTDLGGRYEHPPARSRANTQRDPYSFPPLPSRSILKIPEVSEPPVNKFQTFERALLFVTTAAAFVIAVVLLFADLR